MSVKFDEKPQRYYIYYIYLNRLKRVTIYTTYLVGAHAQPQQYLVVDDGGLEGEGGDDALGVAVLGDLSGPRVDVDHVVHVEVSDVALDGQRSAVLHGVEEDGRDLAADADAAAALVGHEGDIVAHVPQDAVSGRLAGGAGAHHVAYVCQRKTLGLGLAHLGRFDEQRGAGWEGESADRYEKVWRGK